MAAVELIMPKMGESIMEATVLKWLKKPGDSVGQDESVLEVATDKVDTEVPSMYAGVLVKILAQEGEVVQVGKAIAILESDSVVESKTKTVIPPPERPAEKLMQVSESVSKPSTGTYIPKVRQTNRFFSPLVRTIAKSEKISTPELETIQGTGAGGRVTKKRYSFICTIPPSIRQRADATYSSCSCFH